jgi:hypothetical protein
MVFGEYISRNRQEVQRIKALHNEAIQLEQYEKAKELRHELYELGFEQYRFLKKINRLMVEIGNAPHNPKIKKLIKKFEKGFDLSSQQAADDLEKFIEEGCLFEK